MQSPCHHRRHHTSVTAHALRRSTKPQRLSGRFLVHFAAAACGGLKGRRHPTERHIAVLSTDGSAVLSTDGSSRGRDAGSASRAEVSSGPRQMLVPAKLRARTARGKGRLAGPNDRCRGVLQRLLWRMDCRRCRAFRIGDSRLSPKPEHSLEASRGSKAQHLFSRGSMTLSVDPAPVRWTPMLGF